MDKVIIWDFDGTLGYREGNWEEVFFELSIDKVRKTKDNFNLVSQMLKKGFPWHESQKSFVSIKNNYDWWEYVKPRFVEIFIELGYDKYEAIRKADLIPQQYSKLSKWKLYSDAKPSLTQLQKQNWKSILVTNNIPEFPVILKHLCIDFFFEAVFVSSLIGYNKPNPLILNNYLELLGDNTKVFVVGDREESDVELAKSIQAEGILVRSKATNAAMSFINLNDMTKYLSSIKIV